MSETETLSRQRNPLGQALVDTIRRLRLARLVLRRSRQRHQAVCEGLHVALAVIVEKDEQVDNLRRQNAALRSEIRRYTAKQVPTERAA